jgi:hypothetical protein
VKTETDVFHSIIEKEAKPGELLKKDFKTKAIS